MEQTIKSVKLKAKNRLKIFLEGDVDYNGIPTFEKTIKEPPFAEATEQLTNSFKRLLPHFLLHIKSTVVKFDAEYIKQGKAVKDNKLKDFAVTGFTISGDGDEEKVVLEGKIMEDDKGMPVKTLKICLYGNDDYPFSNHLVEDLQAVIGEVKLFLNGKFKTDPQRQMDFSIDENEEEQYF